MKIHESYVGRRRFLGGMLAGGTAAMATGVALPLTYYAGNLRPQPPPPFLRLAAADWDLSPGSAKTVLYGWLPALIIRTPQPEAQIKVFVAFCTHFDCTVGYKADENLIHCACHNGYYYLDGRVHSGPPPEPLRPFYTKVDGDTLIIALEKEDLEKATVEESNA